MGPAVPGDALAAVAAGVAAAAADEDPAVRLASLDALAAIGAVEGHHVGRAAFSRLAAAWEEKVAAADSNR